MIQQAVGGLQYAVYTPYDMPGLSLLDKILGTQALDDLTAGLGIKGVEPLRRPAGTQCLPLCALFLASLAGVLPDQRVISARRAFRQRTIRPTKRA